MSFRSGSSSNLRSLTASFRQLQTSAPLPPPTSSLPPSPRSTGTSSIATGSSPASSSSSSKASRSPSTLKSTAASTASSSSFNLPPLLPAAPKPSLPSEPASAISLITSQSTPAAGRYVLARLHSRTYLLHPRDILTVPQLRPASPPGTVLALTRILEVGSRDYAIRSPAADGKELRKAMAGEKGVHGEWADETVPSWVAQCGLTVLEHTKSPLERIVKKKRRKGYKKTIEHKQGWTRLRVGDIILGDGKQPGIQGEVGLP